MVFLVNKETSVFHKIYFKPNTKHLHFFVHNLFMWNSVFTGLQALAIRNLANRPEIAASTYKREQDFFL